MHPETLTVGQGLLIPSAKLIDRIDILNAEWVLVIEKEVLTSPEYSTRVHIYCII